MVELAEPAAVLDEVAQDRGRTPRGRNCRPSPARRPPLAGRPMRDDAQLPGRWPPVSLSSSASSISSSHAAAAAPSTCPRAPPASASRGAWPRRTGPPAPAASWLPCPARRFMLDVERQPAIRILLQVGQHRRVDQVAVERIGVEQARRQLVERDRPEGVDRRQPPRREAQRVAVRTVERLVRRRRRNSPDRSPPPWSCRRCPAPRRPCGRDSRR